MKEKGVGTTYEKGSYHWTDRGKRRKKFSFLKAKGGRKGLQPLLRNPKKKKKSK